MSPNKVLTNQSDGRTCVFSSYYGIKRDIAWVKKEVGRKNFARAAEKKRKRK